MEEQQQKKKLKQEKLFGNFQSMIDTIRNAFKAPLTTVAAIDKNSNRKKNSPRQYQSEGQFKLILRLFFCFLLLLLQLMLVSVVKQCDDVIFVFQFFCCSCWCCFCNSIRFDSNLKNPCFLHYFVSLLLPIFNNTMIDRLFVCLFVCLFDGLYQNKKKIKMRKKPQQLLNVVTGRSRLMMIFDGCAHQPT